MNAPFDINALLLQSVTPQNWLGSGQGHSVFKLSNTKEVAFEDTAIRIPNKLLAVPGDARACPPHLKVQNLASILQSTSSLTPAEGLNKLPGLSDDIYTLTPSAPAKEQITLIARKPGINLYQHIEAVLAQAAEQGISEAQARAELADELYAHIPTFIKEVGETAYRADCIIDCSTTRNFMYHPKTGLQLIDGETHHPKKRSNRGQAKKSCEFAGKFLLRSIDKSFFTRHPEADAALETITTSLLDTLDTEYAAGTSPKIHQVHQIDAVALKAPPHALRAEIDKLLQAASGAQR